MSNFQDELEKMLTKAFNDFYDYITEKDTIKAAHEYSEKTVYKTAITSIINLVDKEVIRPDYPVPHGDSFDTAYVTGQNNEKNLQRAIIRSKQ